MKTVLSVIVAAFNPDLGLLAEMLDSLYAQTFVDFEVILVDDGSILDIASEMDALALKDERVRVLHKRHAGVSAARNAGLDVARGDYVTFVDADDRACAGFFAGAVSALAKTGSDVAIGWLRHVNNAMAEADPIVFDGASVLFEGEELRCLQGFMISGVPIDSMSELASLSPFTAGAKVFKRSILGDLRVNIDLTLGEDGLFNAQVLQRSNRAVVVRSPWYEYHRRAGSATHGSPQEMLKKIQDIERFRVLAAQEGWGQNDIALHCAAYIVQILKEAAHGLTVRQLADAVPGHIGKELQSCVSVLSLHGRYASMKRRLAYFAVAHAHPLLISLLFKVGEIGKR